MTELEEVGCHVELEDSDRDLFCFYLPKFSKLDTITEEEKELVEEMTNELRECIDDITTEILTHYQEIINRIHSDSKEHKSNKKIIV